MPANTYGRQVVEALTNKSGGAVAAGDVVIVDTTNNDAFTTNTASGFTGVVGVAQEAIANNAVGRVLTAGYAALVNVNASVTRGNYGKTFTVAKQATDAGASRVAGAFCQFLTGGTTPDAHVFGMPDASAGVAGALVFLEGHIASSSAQLDFTSFISSTYDTYLIEGSYIRPASDAVDFQMEFGSGGGPTWDTGNNYSFVTSMVNIGTSTTVLDDANTGIPRIFKSIANASQYGTGSFTLTGTDLQSTAQRRKFHGTGIYANTTTPAERMGTIGVTWNDITNAMTGIRFKMSSGDIASGVIRIYGLAKS